ncbi:50S ribosomal protein L37ae [Candidatus Pacearchaeota archaeon]|nr:50S ribosomal protein L37ae [Candidatus Pacearchaeota archaeon]
MATKTKKSQAFGKYGAGYGTRVKKNYNAIEKQQRVRQTSPFYPKGKVKRIAMGIWRCVKTGKIFAGDAYFLNAKK